MVVQQRMDMVVARRCMIEFERAVGPRLYFLPCEIWVALIYRISTGPKAPQYTMEKDRMSIILGSL
jgi:hypothetical protein